MAYPEYAHHYEEMDAGYGNACFNMSKMPMWIHLGNLPLELFTKNGLSYLASALGNPLYMDRITANQQRLAFAKICVEVDASMEIPKFIEVKRRNGSMITIFVDVPWWPSKCSHCRIFGHVDRSCPKKANIASTKVWIPKVSENKVVEQSVNVASDFVKQQQEVNKDIEPDNCMRIMQGNGVKVLKEGVTSVANMASKDGDKSGSKTRSINRFAILAKSYDEDCEGTSGALKEVDMGFTSKEVSGIRHRKTRVASVGVAELMKSLKATRKGPIGKGKNKSKAGLSAL